MGVWTGSSWLRIGNLLRNWKSALRNSCMKVIEVELQDNNIGSLCPHSYRAS